MKQGARWKVKLGVRYMMQGLSGKVLGGARDKIKGTRPGAIWMLQEAGCKIQETRWNDQDARYKKQDGMTRMQGTRNKME
jgi:hypothetical protein